MKYNDLINQETLSFVYKYVHYKLPSVFKKYFSHRHELSEMIEEHRKRRFILPMYKSDFGKSSIKYIGSKIFNEKAPLHSLIVVNGSRPNCFSQCLLLISVNNLASAEVLKSPQEYM